MKYDKDFKLVKSVILEEQQWSGLLLQDKIFCGIKNSSVMVFDLDLKTLKRIDVKTPVERFLPVGDDMLMAEHKGIIQQLNIKSLTIL